MYRHCILALGLLVACFIAPGQAAGADAPRWADPAAQERELSGLGTKAVYGYAFGPIHPGQDEAATLNHLITQAREKLLRSISSTRTEAQIEITGIQTEHYIDRTDKVVHVLVYADRRELAGFYATLLATQADRLEQVLLTAEGFEQSGQRELSRAELLKSAAAVTAATPAEQLIAALGVEPFPAQGRMNSLRERLAGVAARLEGGVRLHVRCTEELPDTLSEPIVADKLKGKLADQAGCRFVEAGTEADFTLHVGVKARPLGDGTGQIVFCYAEATVRLTHVPTGKVVYQDQTQAKGGGVNPDRAARAAFESVVSVVASGVIPWVK